MVFCTNARFGSGFGATLVRGRGGRGGNIFPSAILPRNRTIQSVPVNGLVISVLLINFACLSPFPVSLS